MSNFDAFPHPVLRGTWIMDSRRGWITVDAVQFKRRVRAQLRSARALVENDDNMGGPNNE